VLQLPSIVGLHFKRQHSLTAIRQHFLISSAQAQVPEVERVSPKVMQGLLGPAFLS
jgi:hypothetical protein